LTLPEEVRADQVTMTLMTSNISVSTAEPFAVTDHPPHAIRLALGSVAIDSLKEALMQVKQAIERFAY